MLTKMTHVKVGYHEYQIQASDSEEDVKFREQRIKELQHNLREARQYIAENGQRRVSLQANIVMAFE